MSQPQEFQQGFRPDPEGQVQAQSTRPGQQHKMDPQPKDDVYPDGSPYKPVGKFEGKVVLITGGDSGIGRASAILFALEGANISIVHHPIEEKDAAQTKSDIEQKTDGKSKVLLIPTDLKEEKNCISSVEQTVGNFGRLDVLFNNAGQQLLNTDILSLDSKQWEDTFRLNIFAYFYMAKAAIPHLKPGSTIINNASINAYVGHPGLVDYTSTKGAIVAFTRALSNQIVGQKHIRVNAVAPGPIWTPLVTSTFNEEKMSSFGSVPIGRPGQPIEVATCVIFLASQDSSFISGQTLHPNGGTVING